jgi:radical SAM protein with 4Fe4S-binding SPASM domain
MPGSYLKYINGLSAAYFFLQSTVTKRAVVSGMPPALSIELTNYCNLRCPECNSGSGAMTRSRGYMDYGLFKKILSELKPWLLYLNLYFQGESMMHPDFFKMLRKCEGINSTLSTNGHYINESDAEQIVRSGLSRLIICIDGLDNETYNIYRKNGNLTRVMEAISHISRARQKKGSSMVLELQFLVNRFNEHQIPGMQQLAARMDAKLRLKSMQVISSGSHSNWMPGNRKYRRYEPGLKDYEIKNSFPDRCARLWFNPVITWDGRVVPCCFDKDAEHVMGNMNEESFADIWNGPKFRIFRRLILTDRSTVDICRNCTAGMKGVKY